MKRRMTKAELGVGKTGKSMRQLAKELGVSASYLLQVKHGKHPVSAKVLSKIKSAEGRNRTADTRIFSPLLYP